MSPEKRHFPEMTVKLKHFQTKNVRIYLQKTVRKETSMNVLQTDRKLCQRKGLRCRKKQRAKHDKLCIKSKRTLTI